STSALSLRDALPIFGSAPGVVRPRPVRPAAPRPDPGDPVAVDRGTALPAAGAVRVRRLPGRPAAGRDGRIPGRELSAPERPVPGSARTRRGSCAPGSLFLMCECGKRERTIRETDPLRIRLACE